ncbi:hypothetical protein BV25DRAFT_1824839 [Artomyces pyxidatus]|uniref:Uncharacterized protein n=1 Tax=Artomyces pyxidatus TaxID=48021 RepID=A0ACB8T3Z4_9AGAM|nr:hypothetical protein BV25DRAFT_1824839 [Artomyces pyxidatus]
MSGISSFLPFKALGSINPRELNMNRTPDPGSRLRSALETMPGARKYSFTAATRAEILSELYDAFWGPYAHLFLPLSNSSLPLHATLSEVQTRLNFAGAAGEEPPAPGKSCGYIFKKGESCFRCKDCALDDSCVLCARCFHATDHNDHNVSFFIAQQSGGCCDCGDVEAWRAPINCPLHPAGADTPASLVAFASDQVPMLWGRDIPPVKNYPHRVSVPPELRESMNKTVAYAIDFIIETLDYSPEETSVPTNEADLRLQPSADPMMKDQYCVVLWNDEKHSFSEVVDLLCSVTERTKEDATAIADRIDELGREVIDMSVNVPRVLDIAQKVAQIELGVTVRRAYDTFREQIVAVLIEWLLDLTRSRLGTDALILKEVIAEELLMPRRRGNTAAAVLPDVASIVSEVDSAARLDWLYLYHTKLWKRPRLSLKEIYASILGLSHQHKLSVAAHFANVYPRVIDTYLLVDREAETSIKYFALQLFTVPSVAVHIVRHYEIVSRLLSIITAFFTNQIHDRRIQYPPNLAAEVDVESDPFKSKRFMPVFSDLRYLCHNEPVQRLIAHRHDFIAQFAHTCQLFMCINPNKRAATSHVEFETDGWISVFNVTLSLSRVIKVYGEAFAHATPAELVSAITTVVHNTLMSVTLADDRLDQTKFGPIAFHDVMFGNRFYSIVEFDVLDGWVSFHHSLQWLLAELFKHVDTLSAESLSELGLSSVREILLRNASEKAVLTIIDFPLRVLSMIAQIRTGLWVRNGFAIRGQLLHYRDFMLRELCYDQDLYLLQTALIILDPDLVLVSIMDRFQLITYFTGAVIHHAYEGPQLASMVEEFMYILITILSEGGNAGKMSMPAAVRREIVHALAVGPCTFTDLIKRVAERLVDDACFERVLKEVANFRPPDSTADSGIYELKPEAFDEVNPFFYHYTRNKREEVETVLRNHYKKRGIAEPVIVPRPLGITVGPFAALPSAFQSEVLLQIMFYAVFNILVLTEVGGGASPPSGEAILDQSLHLIMLALVERPSEFSHLCVTKGFEGDKNLIDIICVLENHETYRAYKVRCGWILEAFAQHVPNEVRIRRRVDVAQNLDPEDAKKKAARARQEAIMKQMKAQQASFAHNFEDEDDGEDEGSIDAEEPNSFGTCIVCQEELNSSKPFGALGLVQPSRLIRRHPDGSVGFMNEVMNAPHSMDRVTSTTPSWTFPPQMEDMKEAKTALQSFEMHPPQNTRFGLHGSICSHLMHLECFNVYTTSIRQRHRTQATRNHPESIPRKEYICPLCKSLGNVILPVSNPSHVELNSLPFADWTRAAGISILKSKTDPLLDSLLVRNGTGELVFWGAQDPHYVSFFRSADRWPEWDMHKMVDSVMNISRAISQQTRHLRDRPEPDAGERGAGLYLPEDLVGYTIACLEVTQRGVGGLDGTVADNLNDSQTQMVRGLITCLAKLAAVPFRGRPDEGREALRQAVIKRLLPEWSLSTLNPVSYPLLLRDPFTILVETAAIAPEMLRHVLTLTYYACLARTVIGLIYVLNKTRGSPVQQPGQRPYENIFGDLRMFFTSVVRHSPVVEHASEIVFSTYGEARIEKLVYSFTLPFLRRAAILCRAVLPSAFTSPPYTSQEPNEYSRLLRMLGIPALAELPNQDTLQTSLAGWCSHYGHSHAASQLNCGIVLENPTIYRIARLPIVLDTLFGEQEKALTCRRCNTVPLDAAVCLICGTTVCFQSHCCMDREYGDKGECNMHTRECGGVIGLYFLVKRCTLLYLHAGNGTFAQSPYLDVHGEVDTSMRRGRRQFLHPARWEEVRKTWLNHGIPTLVARKLESTVDSGGWETL